MLTAFRGLYVEGTTIYITISDIALRDFLESPQRVPALRGVLTKLYGADKKLMYRAPRS